MKFKTLASTKTTFCHSTSISIEVEDRLHTEFINNNKTSGYTYPLLHRSTKNNNNNNPNVITHLQWIDASTLLTKSSDNGFRLYIPPSDLLEPRKEKEQELQLIPFIRCFHNTSIQSFETHPLSSIYNGSVPTLTSSNYMPLKLVDLIPDEDGKYRLMKTFNNVNQFNEIYETFQALKFMRNGDKFIAGGGKMLKVFDINRHNPLRAIEDVKGLISTITLSDSEFGYNGFYTGGFNGHLAIHDSNGHILESFKLDKNDGNGVSQILESKNGKYLYVISRNTDHIRVLDLRMGLQELSNYDLKLDNVNLESQRIFGDILENSQGLVMGSTKGTVHWFKDAEMGQVSNHEHLEISEAEGATINNVKVNPDDNNIVAYAFGDRDSEKLGFTISDCKGGTTPKILQDV